MKEPDTKTQSVPADLESFVKNIDFEVKAHRDLRSSINNMLSKALAEGKSMY